MQEHAAASNDSLLLIAQIETAPGVENAPAIATTPGIDVVFVGPGDLSQSLGVPGELNHERVLTATQAVLTAAGAAGKWGGVIGPDNAARWMTTDAPFVVWHQEMTVFKQALAAVAQSVQSQWGWTSRHP
jgi:2-keto-3-deoxy-L-rhamnonate aldolase RhmA